MAKVAVLGGGEFGQALALAFARGGAFVYLWSRRALPLGIDPEGFETGVDRARVADADLLVLAVPSVHVPVVLQGLSPEISARHCILHLSRGLAGDRLLPMSEIIREYTACRRIGVLAGPLHPAALRQQTPMGVVVGTAFPEIVADCRRYLSSSRVRVYRRTDLASVEWASALTGLLLFVVGFARGMGLAPATIGTLVARGLRECGRLMQSLNADPEMLFGLAGSGVLFSAIAGESSPEVLLGQSLAQANADVSRQRHVEAAGLAALVSGYAKKKKVSLPICEAVEKLLHGDISAQKVVDSLLQRSVHLE